MGCGRRLAELRRHGRRTDRHRLSVFVGARAPAGLAAA
ncbi:MAG: hypothetical protein EPO51_01570 [Phenylobacterium sp.]|nr:MAG: hypothetical protein EPO51_01570 [Phenylobacterium sp.]